MGAKEFTPETLKELRRIKRLRGVSAFCKLSGINEKTFKSMVKNGAARADVVEKVEKHISEPEKTITAEAIQTIVCIGYGLSPEGLFKGDQWGNEAKQVACLMMKEEGKLSDKKIAQHLGYKDRTGAAWARKTISGRLEVETDVRERVGRIREKIKAAA